MSNEYVVTVPVHGYVTYVVDADTGTDALAKVNRLADGIENDEFQITWIGKARDARETEQSKIDRRTA